MKDDIIYPLFYFFKEPSPPDNIVVRKVLNVTEGYTVNKPTFLIQVQLTSKGGQRNKEETRVRTVPKVTELVYLHSNYVISREFMIK